MPTVVLSDHLRHRPSVHQLCSGVFIQEHVWLSDQLLVVPLRPLGLDVNANYVAQYTSQVAGAPVDDGGIETLRNQGSESLPVVSICRKFSVDAPPEDLDAIAERDFPMARRLVGWIAQGDVSPFGQLTLTSSGSYFKLLASDSSKCIRLGFGNTGVTFHSQVAQVFYAAQRDEHFSFSLSLYDDALREENLLFRAARFFNCLECFAAYLKRDVEGKSRAAVKALLGLDTESRMEASIGGVKYRFDPIEIGGRIRDKLFHGARFKPDDLNVEARHAYDLLVKSPEVLAKCLQGYCELEIARWGNGTSRGLKS